MFSSLIFLFIFFFFMILGMMIIIVAGDFHYYLGWQRAYYPLSCLPMPAPTTGYDHSDDTRTVDVHIRHLRMKIEKDPNNPELIETIRE